ncbi:MAG: flagellar export protein FliJ [Candidatus Treponema excrementipullorum]|uniref:Flagellar FliJ protein n=1 Tax=Candidatus Treponema excrementipullorum TaxID=2838768 RepID=A0A9E2KZU5_9SPIR|nr:flagellar export protein FliJ [Candidatus Treponema excrementipullorum]
MKKFVFSMEKILDLREYEEKQAQIELGKAIADAEKIRQQLNFVAIEKAKMLSMDISGTSINERLVHENYLVRLDRQKEVLLEELAAAELIVEEKRAVFAEALKKRKVLSNLKEKQLQQYKKEKQLEEDNIVDDIVTSRFKSK